MCAFFFPQVALSPAYYNVTSEQANLSTSIGWGRPAPVAAAAAPKEGMGPRVAVASFSAVCFYFG